MEGIGIGIATIAVILLIAIALFRRAQKRRYEAAVLPLARQASARVGARSRRPCRGSRQASRVARGSPNGDSRCRPTPIPTPPCAFLASDPSVVPRTVESTDAGDQDTLASGRRFRQLKSEVDRLEAKAHAARVELQQRQDFLDETVRSRFAGVEHPLRAMGRLRACTRRDGRDRPDPKEPPSVLGRRHRQGQRARVGDGATPREVP